VGADKPHRAPRQGPLDPYGEVEVIRDARRRRVEDGDVGPERLDPGHRRFVVEALGGGIDEAHRRAVSSAVTSAEAS